MSNHIEFIIEGYVPDQIGDKWEELENFILEDVSSELGMNSDICVEIFFSENLSAYELNIVEQFDMVDYMARINALQPYEVIIRSLLNSFALISFYTTERLRDNEDGDKYWDGRIYSSDISEKTAPWVIEANLKENDLYSLWERKYGW